ncbi:MAG TPA: adenosylcobinamide-GDP ribazoletransferase [Acetobacteraceae bacterium]|nr:adenosylcobinamide-GDP ribazoletransferase [Acetobacteraceae bacterium]
MGERERTRPALELAGAFVLLTRLNLAWLLAGHPPVTIDRTVWAFPLIGAVVGVVGGAAYAACAWAGMPPVVASVWALTVMVVVTGALHEDGLADTADGFGGGRTRERKLEIMRDSHIGSFGAIALILSLAARGAAIAALGRPLRVLPALVTAASLGRAAVVVPLLLLVPARSDGLAVGLRAMRRSRAVAALAIAAFLALVLMPLGAALRAMVGAVIVAVVLSWIAWRQIGGYTGDVLGAVSLVAECVAIGMMAIMKAGH